MSNIRKVHGKSDTNLRLIECFSSVFPTLNEVEILEATQESMAAWDSLAAVTLVNVVEDEFGIEIQPEATENLSSFERFRNFLATTE